MHKENASEKKQYFPPQVTKLTQDQARQFVKDRTNRSDHEVDDLLESLRQEGCDQRDQHQKTS